MTREFVQERLFKPFDTTKGSKGMGIGAYQVREYIQSLGGRVEVRSAPGKGTVMALRLPLTTPPADFTQTEVNQIHTYARYHTELPAIRRYLAPRIDGSRRTRG